jgi:predicted RecB family endonuclease
MLDLNETESEKFLIKYNASEKAIQEKREALDRAVEALQNRVEEKASKEELTKQSDIVINLQTEFQNQHLEKLKSMKSVLNEKNYAMFLVFESNFMKELQKHIFDLMKKRGGPGGEGKGKKWDQEPE